MSDLNNIKDKLQNFEVEYNPQDWIKLEKALPKPGLSGLTKTILVAASVIVTVTAAIFFINAYEKDSGTSTNKVVSNTIIDDNTNIINEIDNVNIDNDIINNTEIATSNDNSTENNNKNNTIIINDDIIDSSVEDTNIDNNEITENNNNNTQDNISNQNDQNQNENEIIIPDISKVRISYNISENCTPATITFSVQNLPTNCKAMWNTGDNARIYGTTAKYTYNEDGSFYPEMNILFDNNLLQNNKLDEIILNSPTNAEIIFDNSENLYYFSCDNEEELDLLWTIDNQEFRERDVRYTFNKSADYIINLSIVNQFGCKSIVNEQINVVIEHLFYLPNAFIPNVNGINSEFGPIGENMSFESYQLIIVDGHGKIVFSSNDVDFKWNGKINNIGENAKPGFYLWEVNTMDEYSNKQTKKGRVNLIWN